jgi:hypothetical protein
MGVAMHGLVLSKMLSNNDTRSRRYKDRHELHLDNSILH